MTALTNTVIMDDFESYASDEELARIWYRPPHGNWTRQTREPEIKSGGAYSLKFEYRNGPEHEMRYAAICRVQRWDLTGCNALQFWLKPDGSGGSLTVQINIANAQGRNIHDLWDFNYFPDAGDDAPRLVTIPFSAFVHNIKYADSPDVHPTIKPADVIELAFYIGVNRNRIGEGAYYFDDILGVSAPEGAEPTFAK